MKKSFCLLFIPAILFILSVIQFISAANPNDSPSLSIGHYKIAFQSRRENRGEIYIINDDGTGEQKISQGNHDCYYPVWAPDNSKLLYLSRNGSKNEIWTVAIDGSNPNCMVKDCDPAYLPSWSPDGGKILFEAKRDGKQGFFVINADGSHETRYSDKTKNATYPSWSPDGSKIVYIQVYKNIEQVLVVNADGTSPTVLTQDKMNCTNPSWSPDGQRIVYLAFPVFFGDPGLYIINNDGSNQLRLTDFNGIILKYHFAPPGSIPIDNRLYWSPDGNNLAYSLCDHEEVYKNDKYTSNAYWFGIYAIETSGKKEPRSLLSTNREMQIPQWSPGNQYLACVSEEKIYLLDINHNFASTTIKIPKPGIYAPAWSSDSTEIACSGSGNIYIVDVNSMVVMQLTNSKNNFNPVWSPKRF